MHLSHVNCFCSSRCNICSRRKRYNFWSVYRLGQFYDLFQKGYDFLIILSWSYRHIPIMRLFPEPQLGVLSQTIDIIDLAVKVSHWGDSLFHNALFIYSESEIQPEKDVTNNSDSRFYKNHETLFTVTLSAWVSVREKISFWYCHDGNLSGTLWPRCFQMGQPRRWRKTTCLLFKQTTSLISMAEWL